MDFTGFNIQDHYNAVVQEREREIRGGAWRRELDAARRAQTPSCCASDAPEPQGERALTPGRPAADMP